MKPNRTTYQCSSCKANHSSWKGCCHFCNSWNTIEEIEVVKKPYHIPAFSQKKLEERKQQLESGTAKEIDLWYDFQIDVAIKSDINCENCGKSLMWALRHENKAVNRSVVAHVLPKRKKGGYPSVATHPLNRVFICGMFSTNRCHDYFDKDMDSMRSMPVFKLAIERYQQFKHLVTESKSHLPIEFQT